MKNRTLAGLMAAPLLIFALSLARCGGGHRHDNLSGRHHQHLDGQGDLQRSRRRPKGRENHGCANGTGSRASRTSRGTGCTGRRTCRAGQVAAQPRRARMARPVHRPARAPAAVMVAYRKPRKAAPAKAREHAARRAAAPAAAAQHRLRQQRRLRPPPNQPRRPSRRRPRRPAIPIPPGATAKCKDGTYSKSAHRSGTCSSHGGVDTWLTAAQ